MSRSPTGEGLAVPGVVVRQDARGCRVRVATGEELWCAVRGRVHLIGATTATTTVCVGDRVQVHRIDDERGAIQAIEPRTSVLSRPDPHHDRRQHVLAANLDQVVVAASAAEPAFTPGFVDRILVVAEWSRLKVVLAVNKIDLVEAPPVELDAYRRLGVEVLLTSAVRGDGVEALRAALAGRVSAITGHSGVGKSSLLNAVEPGLALKVGRVNDVSRRGRQTTTASTLVTLSSGGSIVDTPGIREFGLFNLPRRELPWLFADLKAVASACRFPDCLHHGEPGCAVPAAIERGEIAPWRHASYLRMLESLSELAPWEMKGKSAGRPRPRDRAPQ